MRSTRKFFLQLTGAVFITIASVALSGCDVFTIGLGNSVDTKTPDISITYPPKPVDASERVVIRDWFILAGTINDDIGVSSVDVTLSGGPDNQVLKYKADISEDKKSWKIELNKNKEFLDGEYSVSITASDDAKHTRTVERAIVIDNTAPVLILQSPLSAGNSETLASYGRTIKFYGDVSDANKKYLDVYFAEDTSNGSDSTFEAEASKSLKGFNVSNGMNSDVPLKIARFESNTSDSILNNNYKEFFGTVSDDSNDAKYYYAGIVLSDNAKVYQNPEETENNSEGNKSEKYYLRTDEFTEFLNENGLKDFSANDLMKISNGTYRGSDYSDKDLQKRILDKASINSILFKEGDKVTAGLTKFTVDPDNAPFWSIDLYNKDENGDVNFYRNGFRSYTKGNPLTLNLIPNADKDAVNPKEIALYYREVGTEEWKVIIEKGGWVEDAAEYQLSHSFVVDNIDGSKFYEFKLEGEDSAKNDYSNYEGNEYGFWAYESSEAPNVKITSSYNSEYINSKINDITFSGTVTCAGTLAGDPVAKLTVTKDGVEIDSSYWTDNKAPELNVITFGSNWSVSIPKDLIKVDGKYKFKLTVLAYNTEKNPGEAVAEFYDIFDTTEPVLSSVSIDGKSVFENGSIKTVDSFFESAKLGIEVKYDEELTGLTDVTVVLEKENVVKQSKTITVDENGRGSITLEGFTNGANAIYFHAKDKAGNKSGNSVRIPVKVNLDTPIITIDNLASTSLYGNELYDSGFAFSGKITLRAGELDSVEPVSATLKVTDENSNEVFLTKDGKKLSVKPVLSADKKSWSFTIPSGYSINKDGKYTVELTVSAKNSAKVESNKVSSSFTLNVDTKAPEVKEILISDKPLSDEWLGSKTLKIGVVAEDSGSGIYSVVAHLNGKEISLNPIKADNKIIYTSYADNFIEGNNEIYFELKDNSGNTGNTEVKNVRVSLGLPNVSINSGIKDLYLVTKKELTISGTVDCIGELSNEMKAILSISDGRDDVELPVVKSDKNTWTVKVPFAEIEDEGDYTYTVTVIAKNIAGQEGKSSVEFNVRYDTTAPDLDAVRVDEKGVYGFIGGPDVLYKDYFNKTTMDVEVTYIDDNLVLDKVWCILKRDGIEISRTEAEVDNDELVAKATVSGFEEGNNYVSFYAIDESGNESEISDEILIKVNLGAPTVTVDTVKETSISAKTLASNGFVFSGKAATASKKFASVPMKGVLKVTETISGKTSKILNAKGEELSVSPVLSSDGTWKYVIPAGAKFAEDGIYKLELSVSAFNSVGFESEVESASTEVVVDTNAPVFNKAWIEGDKIDDSFTSPTLKVNVDYTDKVSGVARVIAYLNEKETELSANDVDGKKIFSGYVSGFEEGKNTLTFVAIDYSSNKSKPSEDVVVNVDRGIPVVSITKRPSGNYIVKDALASGIKVEGTVTSPSGKPVQAVFAELSVKEKNGKSVEWNNESKKTPVITVDCKDGINWSFVIPTDKLKNDGEYIYTVSVKAQNSVGREGAVTTTSFDVVVDRTAPAFAYAKIVEGENKVDLTSKEFDSKSLDFEIKYNEEGSGLSYVYAVGYDSNKNQLFSKRATLNNGLATITITGLVEGINNVYFYASDEAGNSSGNSKSFAVKVNLGAPVVTINAINNAPVSGKEFTEKGFKFTGKASTASKKFSETEGLKTVLKVTDKAGKEVQLKKGDEVLSIKPDFNKETGDWSFSIPAGCEIVGDGKYTVSLSVTAKNSAEVASETETVSFSFDVDTKAPVYKSATIDGKDITKDILHKSGTLEVAAVYDDENGSGIAKITAYVNGVAKDLLRSTKDGKDVYSSYVTNFREGENEIYFVAVDNVGNESAPSKKFTAKVTLTAPFVRVTSKLNDSYYASTIESGITVSGSVQNADTMRAELSVVDTNGKAVVWTSGTNPSAKVTVSSDKKTWTVAVPKDALKNDGTYTYTLSVYGTNAAGVESDAATASFDVVVDRTAPVLKALTVGDKVYVGSGALTPGNQVFNSSTIEVSAEYTDATTSVKEVYAVLKVGKDSFESKANIINGIATVRIDGFKEGVNYIYLYAKDTVGNTSVKTIDYIVNVNLGAPTISVNALSSTSISAADLAKNGIAFSGKVSTPSGVFAETPMSAELKVTETISNTDAEILDANGKAISVKPVLSDGTWSYTIPAGAKFANDGKYKIELSVKAFNSVGTESKVASTAIEVVKDSNAPVFVKAEVAETKTGNVYTSSTLKIQADYSDAISGVAKVVATLNGKTTDLILSGTDGTKKTFYNYLTGFEEGENTVTFVATDYAGNSTSVLSELKVNVILNTPVVKITSKVSESYYASAIEGGITVSGSAVYADTIAAELSVVDANGNAAVWASGTKPSAKVTMSSDNKTWTVAVPKDALKNDGTYTYTLTVKGISKAGVTTDASTSFDVVVDRTKPVIKTVKLGDKVLLGAGAVDSSKQEFDSRAIDVEVGYLENGSGLSDVYVEVLRYDAATKKYNVIGSKKAVIGETDANGIVKSTVSLTCFEEGNNYVRIHALDSVNNESGNSNNILVRVNLGAPLVSVNPLKDSYIYSQTLEKSGLSFSGKFSTASGKFASTPLTANVSIVNKDKEAENKIGKLVDANGNEISVKPVLEVKDDKYTGIWTYTIPAGTKISGDGKYTLSLTATATNSFGASTTSDAADIELIVDTTGPVYGNAVIADNAVWNSSSSLNVKANFTDATSGVKEVYYYVAGSNVKPTDISKFKLLNGADATVNDFANVRNYIFFYAKDNAGNASEISEGKVVNVDKTTPTVNYTYYKANTELVAASNTVLTNAKNKLVIYGNVSDADSGLYELGFTKDNADLTASFMYSDTEITPSNVDSITFNKNPGADTKSWKAEIAVKDIANGVVRIKASDKAFNVIEQQLFTLNVDTESPVITLSSPETKKKGVTAGTASVINETVVFKGNASDNYSLNSIALSYSLDGTTYVPVEEPLKGSRAYSWSFKQKVSDLTGASKKIFDAEVTKEKTVYFKLEASDDAGNTATDIYEYVVDPESDRPVITIMGIGLDKMNGATKINAGLNSNTLSGTVSDDDGIEKLEYSVDGKTYLPISVINGAWNITITDGSYKLYFKVKDKENKTFTSTSGSYLTPVLTDGSDSTKSKFMGKADTKLYLMVDKTAPEVKSPIEYSYDGTEYVSDFSSGLFGGKTESFYVKVNAKDANHIKSVSLKVEEISSESKKYEKSYSAKKGSDADGYETWIISNIDVSKKNVKSGKYKLTFTVEDNAGMVSTETETITVDNTAPVVTPAKSSVNVSSTATVNGEVNETADIYYGVSASEKTAPKKYTQIDDATFAWYVYFDGGTGVGTHDYMFKNILVDLGITTQQAIANGTYTTLTPVYVWVKASDSYGNESVEKVKVIVDPQGDRPSVQVTYPEADSVTLGGTIRVMGTTEDNIGAEYVWIQIDSNGDNKFDLEDCEKFFKDNKPLYELVNIEDGTEYKTLSDISESDVENVAIRIPVNGSSWSLSINEKGEFNSATDEPNTIKLNIVATDNDKGDGSKINKSFATERSIRVDKNTPGFDQNSLRLVQYLNGNTVCEDGSVSEGTIARSMTYIEGMSVKGVWYLVGDIKDDSGISKISYKSMNVVENTDSYKNKSYSTDGINFEPYSTPVASSGYYNYTMKLKVGSTEGVGANKINVEAWEYKSDGNSASVSKTFSIIYDNVAPTIASENVGGSRNPEFRLTKDVANTDGFYSFGSTAYENTRGGVSQTGVSKIAFYITSDDNLYDVMLAKTDDNNTVSISDKETEEGLYWKDLTVSSVDGTTVTLSSDDGNVHAGGLIKINNVIYTIKNKADAVLTLSGEPGNATEAKYALANIVDNTTAEGQGTSKNENGYYTNGTYDDGDNMIESLVKQGTKAIWEANINSKNVPDGKAVLHYVVYDAAGNFNAQTYNIVVKNNQPRIAGVKVGTDYNGNGIVDTDEFVTSYSNLNPMGLAANGRDKVSETTIPTQANGDRALLSIKGNTIIKPEIVGGNDTLGYEYKVYKKGSSTAYVTQDLVSEDFGEGNGDSDDVIEGLSIELPVKTILEKEIEDGNLQKFEFKFWDSTPGSTIGDADSGSMCATMNLIMNVALRDSTPAENKIRPFYWNSNEDNSLFNQSTAEGHIELPSDLNGTKILNDANTKLADRDPKVSGKIKIEGYAHDNTLLSSLKIKMGNREKTIATYENGEWNQNFEILTSGGVSLTDDDEDEEDSEENLVINSDYNFGTSISRVKYWEAKAAGYITEYESGLDDAYMPEISEEYGHLVHWIFYVDTEELYYVNCDVNISVSASDRGSARLDSITKEVKYTSNKFRDSNILTTESAYSDKYRVDIVPYITEVKTKLSSRKTSNSSVFNRTALGHYSVKDSELLYVKGFNIRRENVYFGEEQQALEKSSGYVKVPVSNFGTSGELTLTVGSSKIKTLNNMNNNNAKGSYSRAISDASKLENKISYAYNRVPNKVNNNNLTDDVYIDVWQINDKVAMAADRSVISDPVMKINPKTGKLGFAFSAGKMHFSMSTGVNKVGKNGNNGTEYSYKRWMDSYEPMTSVGFTFDANGNSYGVVAGGDTNASEADNFNFVTSWWGDGDHGNSDTDNSNDSSYGSSYGDSNATGPNKALALEKIGQRLSSGNAFVLDKNRIVTPSLAVSGENVFLAYYDAINDEIRFRAGKFDKQDFNSSKGDNNNFGTFYNGYKVRNVVQDNKNIGNNKYDITKVNVPVSNGSSSLGKPGPSVSIAAISDTKVAMVWFDKTNNSLMFAVNKSPLSSTNNANVGTNLNNWDGVRTIRNGAGQYCQIAVDANGGIHVAALESNDDVTGALVYAYAPPSTNNDYTFTSCVVDADGLVGYNLTIDVSIENGKPVPRIGYYGLSSELPKFAYLATPGSIKDGMVNDVFTGAWEVSYVPTRKVERDRINVAVYKNSNGAAQNIPSNSNTVETQKGIAYGNGTKNAILAYQWRESSTEGYIETAQLK